MIRFIFCNQNRRVLFRRNVLLALCVLATVSFVITFIHVLNLRRRPQLYRKTNNGPTSPKRGCPPPPPPLQPIKVPYRFPGLSCSPKYHIGFLKTHRTGSSAVQGLLFRLAARHRLVPLLPPVGSHLVGVRPFHASDRCNTIGRELGPHIINVALRWDHHQIQQVLPNDTVFISIVREPVDQFVSMFRHLELDRFIPLREFATHEPISTTRLGGVYGQNQQLWDFGLPEDQLTNEQKIKGKVAEIDRQFDLVLVAERMDESLVLLRHLLCWPVSYVVTMRVNTLMTPLELPSNSTARHRLERWLSGDGLLYRHFSDRLEQRVRQFGEQRMREEVAELHRETRRVVNECQIVRSPPDELPEWNRWTGDRVYGYSAGNSSRSCQMYVAAEHTWVAGMRDMVEQLTLIH